MRSAQSDYGLSGLAPDKREDDGRDRKQDSGSNRDPVQVLFDHGGTTEVPAAHPATEHVGHAATTAGVEQDQEDEAQRYDRVERCNNSSQGRPFRTNPANYAAG